MTTEEKRSKLVSETNYQATKHFSEDLLAIEMKKTKVIMNKPVYIGMSVWDISKTLMYKFWYDYIKPKYEDKAKLCYMDTDSFVIHIITEDLYKDIANDVERWFDISNYDYNDKRPFPMRKNKKVIGLFKDELGGKIMKEFCALRPKVCVYLMNDNIEKKKAKGTKKCVIKSKTFENYADSLFNNKIVLKIQQRFKRDHHNVYTENINKIALSSNDDKRLQIFDKTTTYPHGTNTIKVCEIEMLMFMKYKHFVPIETNRICKTIVAKCILNKSIIFRKGEMFSVMKYKRFFAW